MNILSIDPGLENIGIAIKRGDATPKMCVANLPYSQGQQIVFRVIQWVEFSPDLFGGITDVVVEEQGESNPSAWYKIVPSAIMAAALVGYLRGSRPHIRIHSCTTSEVRKHFHISCRGMGVPRSQQRSWGKREVCRVAKALALEQKIECPDNKKLDDAFDALLQLYYFNQRVLSQPVQLATAGGS